MPEPQPFIVGRQSEVERFAMLVEGRTPYWLLNIYGPGGIGKTVVCRKLTAYAHQQGLPIAMVDGIRPDLTPDRVLHSVSASFSADGRLSIAFRDFEQAFEEYLTVQDVLQGGGGVQAMFDVVGNVKDPAGLAEILGNLGKAVTESMRRTVSNRFALDRYLRGVERSLTARLSDGLSAALEQTGGPLAMLVDTYEEMEGLDDWVCRTFVPALPEGVKVVIFGRNALPKVNFDWGEYSEVLHMMELPELSEADAKAYLVHHGLRDAAALDEVFRFTGGYPLLLVLVVHLAREAGGWEHVGTLESAADRDRVATQLLERILREERARQVRDFLEKGVVARWFDPEIVSVVLDVSSEEGRAIYDKLQRHSFVERHPYGLKFHDKIRELLLERLKFNRPEYERITRRLTDYYAERAGIPVAEEAKTQVRVLSTPEPPVAKYTVHIEAGQGIVIGDQAQVVQTFRAPESGEVSVAETQAMRQASRLRQLLAERLDLEELRTLCFDLGVDLDSLRGVEGKAANVRELILYLERRGDIHRLETWVRQHRPDIFLSGHSE